MDELARRREQKQQGPDVIGDGRDHGPYVVEERPVGPGVYLSIYTNGRHDARCIRKEYGWMCWSTCQVSDMRQAQMRRVQIEEVFGYERVVTAWWIGLFARWRVERVTRTRTFINGRCMFENFREANVVIERGRSLHRRLARRPMARAVGSDAIEPWTQL